jgi:hypothetical protein
VVDESGEHLRDLRDDGVSEASKAVHPGGYPISHSTHVGFREPRYSSSLLHFSRATLLAADPPHSSILPLLCPEHAAGVGHIFTRSRSFTCMAAPLFRLWRAIDCAAYFALPPPDASWTFGVGHNPDAIPSVRGIDGASWNNNRKRGVTDGFQVRKHAVECHVDDASNVFTNDPSGLGLRNNSAHFRPEVTVILLASALPGVREGLAGEASGKHVNPGRAGSASDVSVIRDTWPMLSQDGGGIGVNFGESNGSESLALKGKAESADAAKQVEMGWLFIHLFPHPFPQCINALPQLLYFRFPFVL